MNQVILGASGSKTCRKVVEASTTFEALEDDAGVSALILEIIELMVERVGLLAAVSLLEL